MARRKKATRKKEIEIKDLLVSGFDEEDVYAMTIEEYEVKTGTIHGFDLELYKKRANSNNVYARGKVPIGTIIVTNGYWGTEDFMYPCISIYEATEDGLKKIYSAQFYAIEDFSEDAINQRYSEISKVLEGKVKFID